MPICGFCGVKMRQTSAGELSCPICDARRIAWLEQLPGKIRPGLAAVRTAIQENRLEDALAEIDRLNESVYPDV